MVENNCEMIKFNENLLRHNAQCLEILKRLEILTNDPSTIPHFRISSGLITLRKFIDVQVCQETVLNIFKNCCVEEESCQFLMESELSDKLAGILSETKDIYIKKCVIRFFGAVCLHSSCISKVMSKTAILEAFVNIMENNIDETFLYNHLKILSLLDNRMVCMGVTIRLSEILKKNLSLNLVEEILKLIHYFLNGLWIINYRFIDKCQLTLDTLVEVVKDNGKQSKRVERFILQKLLLIECMCSHYDCSKIIKMIVNSFNLSQCYKEKRELLDSIEMIAYDKINLDLFESKEGVNMLLESLHDPLLKSSFPLILNIFNHIILNYEDLPPNFVDLISFCLNIIKESTFFSLFEITDLLLRTEEKNVSRVDGNEIKRDPEKSSVRIISLKSLSNEMDVPTKKTKCDWDGYKENLAKKQPNELYTSSVKLLSSIAKNIELQKHLNFSQHIRTLLNAIASSPYDENLLELVSVFGSESIFLKIFISEMVLPMLDLFIKIFSCEQPLYNLYFDLKETMPEPALLECNEFIASQTSRLECILYLCHTSNINDYRKKISRQNAYCIRNADLVADLISCIYEHQHPLRLLAITSFCHLFSSIPITCECISGEYHSEEKKEVTENDYDVIFVVGQECIKSVKRRLMQHSDVFTAMFNGKYCEINSSKIIVTDTLPEAFRLFNLSLLDGRFKSELFESSNCDLLLQVLKLANKYLVTRLEWQISRKISSNLDANLDAIVTSNLIFLSRPLFLCCLRKEIIQISVIYYKPELSPDTFHYFLLFLETVPQQVFTEIFTKIILTPCKCKN